VRSIIIHRLQDDSSTKLTTALWPDAQLGLLEDEEPFFCFPTCGWVMANKRRGLSAMA
jgi:hypothetical protein